MKFKRSVKIIFASFLVLIAFLLIENRLKSQKVGKIHIDIKNQADNYFLDSLEIHRLLSQNDKENIQDQTFKKLSIKRLESRVKANLFVNNCEIARNLSGDLFIEVTLSRPVARFIREKKPDFYIDSLGKVMPVLDRFTARVLVVTRAKDENIPDFKGKDQALLGLLKHIYQDEFLRAQVTQIDIDESQQLTLYLQLGKQSVVFGGLGSFEEKLKKLKIFYKEILPLKGWDAYKKINLKYDKQIICE